jgi:5'-nucleotidase/UDP-sugar diphosphatase
MRSLFAAFVLVAAGLLSAAEPAPEAIVVVAGDMHSAYEKSAAFVARVERLRTENPGVPLAVLIDGDTFELGNAVARRSEGTIEFAMLAALARRGPVILNLGNHEPEFFGMAETVSRLRAAGVIVLGGNLRDPATGQPYADASARVKLGAFEVVVAGVSTDRLSTYRAAVRPTLDPTEPVTWAKRNFPALLAGPALPIVMTHTGLKVDRDILPLLPDGSLFAGAHDHLRFVHRTGRTVYFHSGSWTEFISVARLRAPAAARVWDVEAVPIQAGDPQDPATAALVRQTMERHLTREETEVVGKLREALGPTAAARFAVEAARVAAGADAAMIGATTFGAGLPAGDVTRFALDASVRFDGPLFAAEVDGAWLSALLARSNQGPDTPFAERAGENLVAVGPATIDPAKRYQFVTTDWVAKNAKGYFGASAPALTEAPGLSLKAAVVRALGR